MNERFCQRVNAGSGLVQNKNGGVLQHHARQRHQLALAKREARAAFAHFTVQAVGQRVKPFAGADLVRNGQYFCIRRLRVCVPNVVRDAAGEQEWQLWHKAELAAIGAQLKAAHVVAVDVQAAGLKFIKAGQ